MGNARNETIESTNLEIQFANQGDMKSKESESKININNLSESIQPLDVGDTIAETFPDVNLAQAVADSLAGGNINAILTQDMIDNCTQLGATSQGVEDLTGIDKLSNLEALYIYYNQLRTIPDSFVNLTKLQTLYLSDN